MSDQIFSVIVPNSSYTAAPPLGGSEETDDNTNRGPVHRSAKSDILFKNSLKGCLTLFETFRNSAKRFPNRPCLGARVVDSFGNVGRFLFKSYSWCSQTSDELASGMIKEGLVGQEGAVCLNASTPNIFDSNGVGEQGARVLGIYMKNCPEWILFEYACYAIKAATVPLYHTLDLPSLKYIVEHTQMTSIVCSLEHGELDNLCQLRDEGAIPALQTVILNIESLSEVPPAVISKAKRCDLRLTCIWDVARVGRAYPARLSTPASTDVATFCYTSGTTGVPKGALITHENILSVANAAISTVFPDLGPTDSYLSFLPLPHIFERMVLTALLASGGAIGFFQGDPLKIVEDTGSLQPTIYCAVPRLLNKIYDKIMLATIPPAAEKGPPESVGAAIKRRMLTAAISTKVAALRADGSCLDHWLWDALLFKKIKTALGMANVRHVVSGGAPLSVSTAEFFKIMLGSGTAVHEGYGLTETTGGLSITETSDKSPSGHVGSVLPCVEVCLADVPSMEYGSADSKHTTNDPVSGNPVTRRCNGRGEILCRGPGVFLGYYRDPINTAAAFTPDGWFRTGDIGIWQAGGQLAIVDRKKNVLKLSQGEYVALEKVENVLSKCMYVSQIFVHGVSTEDRVVGVVIPNRESSYPPEVAAGGDAAEAAFLLSQLEATGRENGLHGFEIVKAVHVERAIPEWTPTTHGLFTPTFKPKRAAFKALYGGDLDRLYADLKGSSAATAAPLPRSRL